MAGPHTRDTICAIATPPGQGGVGVVRVSGPDAGPLLDAVAGERPPARYAALRRFRAGDGQPIDEGLVLWFPGPGSFTGEDVVEFQGHGGPVLLDRLLRRLVEGGARLARPGEFSERAFLNGRMDLARAEAVADLISAESEAAARAAMASLQGAFSVEVNTLVEAVTALRVYVESAIDFPDEEVDFLSEGQVVERIRTLRGQLDAVRDSAGQGRMLRDGMTLVLAGQPNAGKSSLLNALAGVEAAIVTAVAGTTRDLLRERILIDGMPLHVVDTAGLRDGGDAVEQEGVRRAREALRAADHALLVVDDRSGPTAADHGIRAELPEGLAVTWVRTKADLSGASGAAFEADGEAVVRLSAVDGRGLGELRAHLRTAMGYRGGEGTFLARRRHLAALDEAGAALTRAEARAGEGLGDLAAEELRAVQGALGAITGEVTSEDLLGEIFSTFCIGK